MTLHRLLDDFIYELPIQIGCLVDLKLFLLLLLFINSVTIVEIARFHQIDFHFELAQIIFDLK